VAKIEHDKPEAQELNKQAGDYENETAHVSGKNSNGDNKYAPSCK